LMNILIL